jgi:acetyltransferase-like isoleucine patch superfamily enzyme
LKRSIGKLLVWLRWLMARGRASQIGYPKTIGRCFRVGPDVRIGRGATIGHDVRIEGGIDIAENVTIESGALLLGSIAIGAGTAIGRHTYIGTGPEAHIAIGADVLVNDFSNLGAMRRLTIGDHCIFAPYVQITDAEHGMDADQHVKHAPIHAEPVSIGDGVWLGSHVVVLMGARIGRGAVIGAHSLVNGEIADNVIAFGIPARVHRSRTAQGV